jgi:hypothetical protein
VARLIGWPVDSWASRPTRAHPSAMVPGRSAQSTSSPHQRVAYPRRREPLVDELPEGGQISGGEGEQGEPAPAEAERYAERDGGGEERG